MKAWQNKENNNNGSLFSGVKYGEIMAKITICKQRRRMALAASALGARNNIAQQNNGSARAAKQHAARSKTSPRSIIAYVIIITRARSASFARARNALFPLPRGVMGSRDRHQSRLRR